MKFLVVLLLLAGCSHVSIDARTSTSAGGAAPPPGTSVRSGGASVSIHSHSLAALVIAGMFIAAAADYSREQRSSPSFSTFSDWFRGAPPPRELDSTRRISEQDCTRPLNDSLGNLRCR